MAEVRHSRTIAAEPEAIWGVLADFGALSAWADGVDHSCLLHHGDDADPLGLTRRVQVGRDVFVEPVESATRQRRPDYRDADQHRPDAAPSLAPDHRTNRRATGGEALRGTAGLAGHTL